MFCDVLQYVRHRSLLENLKSVLINACILCLLRAEYIEGGFVAVVMNLTSLI